MVIASPQFLGLWDPFQMIFMACFHEGDPNYLLTGTILQVVDGGGWDGMDGGRAP